MAVSETHAMPGTLVPRTIKSNARRVATGCPETSA
jgi:hypothetical protein